MDELVEYLCVIQARLNSSRLPAKIMLDLGGKPLLERVYETVSKSKKIGKIVVATSNEESDDIVELKLNGLGIEYFRGDLNNVLKRFFDTAEKHQAENIVRITADNPLMDASLIDDLISHFASHQLEYSMFTNGIYGLSAEVFSFNALKLAYHNARNDFDREHVTPYLKDNCKMMNIDITDKYKRPELSVTIDTLDDYIRMEKFYLYCAKIGLEPNIDNFMKKVNNEI